MRGEVWELLLSMYTVFLFVDLGQAFQRSRRYKAMCIDIKEHMTFKYIFVRNQVWTILAIWVFGVIVYLADFIFGV